jgi:DNA invertase Pin-like site-specific DNA recombinase
VEQVAGFESQIAELKKVGCEKLYQEQVSSVSVRNELQKAVDYAREGDTFIVTKLDRLARSTAGLMEIIDRLTAKNVRLKILNFGMDTHTPTGKLMLTVLGAVAQFEREVMLERQREGVAKAKAEGKFKGRRPISDRKIELMKSLLAEGILSKAEIAQKLNVGVATLYRKMKAFRNDEDNRVDEKSTPQRPHIFQL